MFKKRSASELKPGVIVIGPSLSQVGGVATFVNVLLSSTDLKEKFRLLHLDTTRGPRGAGMASKLRPVNILYFLHQVAQFFVMTRKYNPRVVHLPVTSRWSFWKAAGFIILAKSMGMKVIAHLHGGTFAKYYRKNSKYVRALIGWVFLRTDVVVALSKGWKEFLLTEVKPNLLIEVIPNSIDWLFAQALSEGETKDRDSFTMLFVGSLGPLKGVFDILNAVPLIIRDYPEAKVLFAGKAQRNGVQAEIDRICRENKLLDNVHFLGEVTGQAKVELFRKASVFMLPSYAEGLPYALLEAMGTGLPVITTPVGAIPEIVQDRINGFLISPGDLTALVHSTTELLGHPDLRRQMGIANMNLIRERYMPEIAMKRFESIYRRLS